MASKYTPIIQQNATWEITITLKDSDNNPIDLTDWTGQSQIRATYDSSTILASPTVTITDGPNGVLKVSLTTTQTEGLVATPSNKQGLPVYDVLITNDDESTTYRILEGEVIVIPGVTILV